MVRNVVVLALLYMISWKHICIYPPGHTFLYLEYVGNIAALLELFYHICTLYTVLRSQSQDVLACVRYTGIRE